MNGINNQCIPIHVILSLGPEDLKYKTQQTQMLLTFKRMLVLPKVLMPLLERKVRVSDKCTACDLYSVASYSKSAVRMIWPLVPVTECVLGL